MIFFYEVVYIYIAGDSNVKGGRYVRGWNLNNYFILIFIERLYKKKSVCGFGGLNRVPLVCGLVTYTTRLSQIYIYSISLLSKVHLGFWLIIL